MSTPLPKRKFLSVIVAGTLILGFIFTPVSHTLEVKQARAVPSFETNPSVYLGTWGTFAQTTIESGLTFALKLKEFSLDAIAWSLVNIIIKEMIQSTTKWVKSGFEGSPAFVTNFEDFMTDIGDKIAGNFIWGAGGPLKGLCSPFALDIKLALDVQYRETRSGGYEAQCTLSQVANNVDRFLGGDFLEGGWDGWYELTQNPQNNPYGALLEAQSALTVEILGEKYEQEKLLDFGKGFFSMKDPNCKPNPDDPDNFDESSCGLVTPGTAIESQLNTALGSPTQRLTVADELNELIGALFSQLAGEILGGVGGLLGSTESQGGGGSVFDRLDAERDPSDPRSGDSVFGDILVEERKYLDLITRAVDAIRTAETYREDAYPDADEPPETSTKERCVEAGALPASLRQDRATVVQEQSRASATISELEGLQNDLATIDDIEADPAVTLALLRKYSAKSIPEAKQKILSQFTAYQSSGVLHTTSEYIEFERQTLPRIESDIASFIESVDRACRGGRDDGGGG